MLYQQDFDRWVHETAQLLRKGRYQELDLPNLLDEIEDMSRRERQALRSNLKIILMHLLKHQYQSEKRS